MKKILFIIFILAILGGAGYWFIGQKSDVTEVIKPVTGPAVQAVYATGAVEPTVMMPISARGTARLVKLEADEGQQVAKGQVLGQLEDSDIQKQLEELQARQEFAQKDYNRKAELLKRGAISKGTADQGKAELDAARAAVERVKAELGYMQLVAPEEGLIIRRDGEEGQLIPANQPVFWLSCCAPLRISAEVDEEDIVLVKTGMPVIIRADAFPGRTFQGTVNSITPKGDAVSRSYRLRVGLNGDTPLMIGMTAETNIVVSETKDALLIPTGAVKEETVWVVQDGKFQKRMVKTGARTAQAVEIKSGLNPDDMVVSVYHTDYGEGNATNIRLKNWKAL